MQTYPLHDAENRLFAFEVSNLTLGRRGLCRIVETIPGASLVRRPKAFSWLREDSFCECLVDGELFEAEEPFGDNSRYWVGPHPPRWIAQTERVHDAFQRW